MSAFIQSGLRGIDGVLENASLAAEAVKRSHSDLPPVTSDFNEHEPESYISKGIEAVRAQIKRGLPVTGAPVELVESVFDALGAKGKWNSGLDDRKMALEYGLTLLSRAPPTGRIKEIEHGAIRLLYRDLPHPPSTNMGKEWQFRSADGSGNSRYEREMGASGTPYSRSCTSVHPLPPRELPDPGLVFDMLEKRDKFVPHPAGLSGLFFNYATTVIHSVFRTSRLDWNINETSSYVDMGILYGNKQEHQDKMRIVDGYGKIIPDSFAETRLLSLPPGVATIIIMFNRNHNYLADMLLAINEYGKWTKDVKNLEEEKMKNQDYEIFNTARLINSYTYANVVLGDYLASILGTVRDGSSWTLDIGGERREADHTILERGAGNSCSVEFNTLYRLHPSMSEEDAKYTEMLFRSPLLFGQDANWDEITPEEFELKVTNLSIVGTDINGGKPLTATELKNLPEKDRNQLKDDSKPRDYMKTGFPDPRVKRDPKTGRYSDDFLAKALMDATAVPAAAFKARGVPHVMRVIEMLGIEQARNWGICSLNEFRRFLGLKPYTTFEEWNPDKKIADAARKLYRTPENLELYVGLVAEDSKPVGDGAGLCPSYTMSRAILADAVALVRGDRHLTYDCTPFNLTSWGFTEGSRNVNNAAWGGMLGRIFSRGLPQHFNAESIYTHFPLVTPTGQPHSMDRVLTRLGLADQYDFKRPTKVGPTFVLSDPNLVFNALSDESAPLVTPYSQGVKDVRLNPSFLSAVDKPSLWARVTALVQNTFVPASAIPAYGTFFHDRTKELVFEKNLSMVGVGKSVHHIDVVKDVFRLVPVHWSSTQIAGLPLKTAFEPRGIYYEQQIYQMLKEIYTFVFHDVEPSLKIPLRKEAQENVERLLRFVKLSLTEAKGGLTGSVLGTAANLFLGNGSISLNSALKRANDLGSKLDETANDVLSVISVASIELSQIFTHVANFYLAPYPPSSLASDEEKKEYEKGAELQAKIVNLATNPSPDAIIQLKGYVREALRLDPVIDGVFRVATANGSIGPVDYNAGDKIFFDFRAIGQDGRTFANPQDVNPARDPTRYALIQGDTVFKVLGEDFVLTAAANVVRAVFSLKNVRRAKGPAGTLRRFQKPVVQPFDNVESNGNGGYKWVANEDEDRTWQWTYQNPEDSNRLTEWATGLTLTYDD